ncbi:type VI secretion system tip protein VgrG [Spartinivicinus ruber]|uniref:type VI secretion system tip protein VgrG n=1 Tax=Spartinivicinus ruber TaxID=2683272 RepID=UPI0013D54FA2|nr:type VI secretion system tip protein VgrG [Spartinivicinus ruber]
MADSPTLTGDGVVEVSVSSNGSSLPDTVRIYSVTVHKEINRIPSAIIAIEDGDMPTQSFTNADSSYFKPGTTIKIEASYDQTSQSIFEGIVVKLGIKIANNNSSRLVVTCKDTAIKMTAERKNVIYQSVKDSDVFSTLMSNHSVESDIETTQTEYNELVQYYCSDWDFLMLRAESNAMVVIVENGKVSVGKPDATASAVLTVEYGQDIYEFSADVDACSQLSSAKAVAWDVTNQAIVTGEGSLPSLNDQGDLDQSTLAKVLSVSDYKLRSATIIDQVALKDWASGRLLKSGLARIRGHMTIQGNANATPGAVIELKGVGSRFSGSVYISAVTHRIADGNWLSDVKFGLSDDWFSEQYQISSPPASGFSAGVEGLQIGVVKKINEDPQGQYRVQLSLPVLEATTDEIWARYSQFYASSGIGAFFMPEIGDEVIVGYFNNDPSNPVILGSLYSKKNTAPYEPDSSNTTKALMTKQKLLMEFNDDTKEITITTPANNQVVFSDNNSSITVSDQHGNTFTLDSSGITLDSAKDISLKATEKVTIEAGSNIEMTASADVKANGVNVSLEASTTLTAKGSSSAEFSASGNTTVKGSMVMIN